MDGVHSLCSIRDSGLHASRVKSTSIRRSLIQRKLKPFVVQSFPAGRFAPNNLFRSQVLPSEFPLSRIKENKGEALKFLVIKFIQVPN